MTIIDLIEHIHRFRHMIMNQIIDYLRNYVSGHFSLKFWIPDIVFKGHLKLRFTSAFKKWKFLSGIFLSFFVSLFLSISGFPNLDLNNQLPGT